MTTLSIGRWRGGGPGPDAGGEQPKAGQSLQQLIYSGFGYCVTSTAEISFPANLMMKYKGKTMTGAGGDEKKTLVKNAKLSHG